MTGKDITLILSQNGEALAGTRIRTTDIQTQAATIEHASAIQQEWSEFIPGRKSWNATVDYLVLASAQVADLLRVGQTFDVSIVSHVGETVTVHAAGTALLESVSQKFNIGNLAKGSFSFRGSGALQ